MPVAPHAVVSRPSPSLFAVTLALALCVGTTTTGCNLVALIASSTEKSDHPSDEGSSGDGTVSGSTTDESDTATTDDSDTGTDSSDGWDDADDDD